ncbi:MAG TPA: hypothetical protein VGX52_16725 [Burkholderiales bacterium]|nr:hypothetical protein [Burkholderiales bacterium]
MRTPMTFIAVIAAACALAQPARAAGQDAEASAKAFKGIAEVLRHPRCMNCHTVTDFPRQGDERRRHHQMVTRGEADKGAPTMQCSNCHQETNSPDGRVPGAHNWHLAPLSMAWEHLPTDKALCEAFVDKKKNGSRDIAAIVHHLTSDPLVQWAWAPGARKPPHISQQEFHALARRWAETGGACPQD